MYPSSQDVDAAQRGTGVFYQALPAVGADGKNIMRLIPVQMVNGQFVHTKPQESVAVRVSINPVHVGEKTPLTSASQQAVRKQIPHVNALPNQLGVKRQCLDPSNSLNKHPRVTVKVPAPPRGQYPQVSPNAQVRTVPAPEPSSGMMRQIFTSAASSFSSSRLPSVVCLSPMMTVNQNIAPAGNSVSEYLSKTSNMTSSSSGGSKSHLKLIPKVSRTANSPMKWVIEEEDSSTTSPIAPLNTPLVTSESHQADRQNNNKNYEVITKEKTVSLPRWTQSERAPGNSSVMCIGKVFFAAKKCSVPFQMGSKKVTSPTVTVDNNQFKNSTTPSSLNRDSTIVISNESDEVIDLCNDDCLDGSSQQTASGSTSTATHVDEDNVIFVSYIPPKSDSGSAQDLKQKELQKETDQTDVRSPVSVTGKKSPDGTTGSVSAAFSGGDAVQDHLTNDARDGSASPRGRNPDQSKSLSTEANVTNVCGAAVSNTEGITSMNSQKIPANHQLESMELDLEKESPSVPSTSDSIGGISSEMETDTHKTKSSTSPVMPSWESSSEPKPCYMADHLLRRLFGITADVKICLPRINEASAGTEHEEPRQNKSTRKLPVEDVPETTSGLKEEDLYTHSLYNPQGRESNSGPTSVKRTQRLPEEELSGELLTTRLHADIDPSKCSLFKHKTSAHNTLKSKCPLGQNSQKGLLSDFETEPLIGYMEPVDDDLPSADESNTPNSQDSAACPQTLNCVNPNANTRRIGRARKRTMCPCCIPATLGPTEKWGARVEEPDRRTWTAEQTSKKGRQMLTKAQRNNGEISGKMNCGTAKNKQSRRTSEVPARRSLSAASMDSDELQREEQIERLKELLKEKEAALEMMRNSLS